MSNFQSKKEVPPTIFPPIPCGCCVSAVNHKLTRPWHLMPPEKNRGANKNSPIVFQLVPFSKVHEKELYKDKLCVFGGGLPQEQGRRLLLKWLHRRVFDKQDFRRLDSEPEKKNMLQRELGSGALLGGNFVPNEGKIIPYVCSLRSNVPIWALARLLQCLLKFLDSNGHLDQIAHTIPTAMKT